MPKIIQQEEQIFMRIKFSNSLYECIQTHVSDFIERYNEFTLFFSQFCFIWKKMHQKVTIKYLKRHR